MGQAVREGRAIVEDELVRAVLARLAAFDRRLESPVGLPVCEDFVLKLREIRGRYKFTVAVKGVTYGLLSHGTAISYSTRAGTS